MVGAGSQLAPIGWSAAAAAAVVGTGVGLAQVAWTRRRTAPASASTAEGGYEDVEAQLSSCLDALRDLEVHGDRQQAAARDQAKHDLEARAVGLLAERDRLAQRALAARLPRDRLARQAPASRSPARRRAGILWAAGLTALVTLLFTRLAGEPSAPAGPPPAGGATSERPPAQGGAETTEAEVLASAVAERPDDVAAWLRLSHLHLRMQRLAEARQANDRALALDPAAVEGLVHAAVLRAADGEGQAAVAALEEILARHQDFAEAWFFRGMLSMQQGDMERAHASFRSFVAVAPDGPQRQRVAEMLRGMGPGDGGDGGDGGEAAPSPPEPAQAREPPR